MSLESLDGFYATHIIDLDKIPDEERTIKSIKAKGKLYNEFKLMTSTTIPRSCLASLPSPATSPRW